MLKWCRQLAVVAVLALAVLAATACARAAALGDSSGPFLAIQACTEDKKKYQQWVFGSNGEITLKSTGRCIDVQGYSTADEAPVWTYTCHPSNPSNQAWSYDATGQHVVEKSSGKVLDRSNYGTTPGTQVWLYSITGVANQKWTINATDSTIRALDAPSMCLDGGSPTPRACDVDSAKPLPYCNTSLSYEDRINDLISRIKDDDLPGLFQNGAGSIQDPYLPPYQWWSEALHGVGASPGVRWAPLTSATSFPQVIHTGATFNKTLYHMIGDAIGTEGRIFNNLKQAGNTFWTPNVNIIRDPRWGRGQETPGEDPYATGTYARNFVSGFQGGSDSANYIKSSSCCKHFFDYNLENWNGVTRHTYNAIASDQDIADTYLPTFEACVRHGKASSLMCSYNAVNGIPSCANKGIMTTIARESWGFDGYITSDCGAVDDVISNHHYTNTSASTIFDVFDAGMDIDCGSYVTNNLQDALSSGAVPRSLVNKALFNLFMVQFRLGQFDPLAAQPYTRLNESIVNSQAHQQLALEASQQGMVLLKNVNKALPLKKGINVALIGPNSDATITLQGNYQGIAPFLISPVQGFSSYAKSVQHTGGCIGVACTNESGFATALKMAKAADVVVMVVGLDQTQESEGHDRYHIGLPGLQNQLIEQVANVAKAPIVVFVMTGGPLDISDIMANPKVGGVFWCGYPGQSGGQAMADVAFGVVNPGGRLPYTMYPASFVNETAMTDNSMRPNATSGNPGRTYRFYTGKAVVPYGAGLSYTTFSYTTRNLSAAATVDLAEVEAYVDVARSSHIYFREGAPEVDRVEVTVNNTGDVAGADVVQLFVQSPVPAAHGNPIKALIGFERVFLKPGESITIQFPLTMHDLTLVHGDGTRHAVSGEWTLLVGHDSRASTTVLVS